MPGAEIATIKGYWSGGALHISDLNGIDVMVVGPPSTGVRMFPAGSVSVVTTSATLTMSQSGQTIIARASTDITLTLPYANSTATNTEYTIVNGASAGAMALVILGAATTETFIGAGFASTAVPYQLTNTAATAEPGDSIQILSGNSTTSIWHILGLTGTWVSTT